MLSGWRGMVISMKIACFPACFTLQILACSSGKPALLNSVTPDVNNYEVADLVSPNVASVIRMGKGNSVVAKMISMLSSSSPACWLKLASTIKVEYGLEVAGAGNYFIVEGDLPKAEVEKCVGSVLATTTLPVHFDHDGEFATFDAGDGKIAYVGWRGPYVIIGSKGKVMDAITGSTKEHHRTWQDRIASLPTAPMVIWRNDQLIQRLFGVQSVEYQVVMDTIAQNSRLAFAGRLVVQFQMRSTQPTLLPSCAPERYQRTRWRQRRYRRLSNA
jgi:hypothetical protein